MRRNIGEDYRLEDQASALEKQMIANGYDIDRITYVRYELSKQYDAFLGN
jgi:hypothetical protein